MGIANIVMVLLPLIGFIVNVLVHFTFSRFARGSKPMVTLFAGLAAGLAAMLSVAVFIFGAYPVKLDFAAGLILSFGSFCCLWYCYFHAININIASLRIRILREVINAGSLSQEDILSRYGYRSIITNRIRRLIDSRQLLEKDERFYCGSNKSFLILFWIFEGLKLIVMGHGNRLLEAAGEKPTRFIDLPKAFWRLEILRFLSIGVVNALFSYGAYAGLVLIGIHYSIAVTISTVCAVIFNYFTTGKLVFRHSSKAAFIRFIMLNVFSYFLNQGFLFFLIEIIRMNKLLAQAVVLPIIVVFLFIINKFWVFKKTGCLCK